MKEYIVTYKYNPTKMWYEISAPSKRIARWCAFNIFQHEYSGAVKVSNFKVSRAKRKDIENSLEDLT